MTRQNVNAMLAALGREAGIEVAVHPHMLRHSTGYKLANEGRDTRSLQHYLGHRNIQSPGRYTELNANDLQVFAVGGDTPRECVQLLREFPGLITSPTFRTGKQLSNGEIKVFKLRPNGIRYVTIFQ